ncbi:MAG: MFS transporter [Nostocales cyanobacterium 94392]|nr:MFS transporter [Nostocales cyanobacterium 94392]
MTTQTEKPISKFISPWAYIPSLYFAEGMPYMIINAVSVVFYKNVGIDNAQITFWTSIINLPWVIKMFWGPAVDIYSTKRRWLLTMQFAMCICLAILALSFQLPRPSFFSLSLAILLVGAFISATYDIATDGFYMLALTEKKQAFFVGIRTLSYRLAIIFSTGFLVYLAGTLEKSSQNIPLSWSITLGFASLIFAILFIFHLFILPQPESGRIINQQSTQNDIPFITVIRAYFAQRNIIPILAFILLYRFGEAMLLKIATLFLLDERTSGGLGLTTSEYGLVYGTFGVISLISGGILGGLLIAKYGLKKCLLPMALALNLPDLFYVYMAYVKPPLELVYPLVSLEQFGYGLGFTAFTVYLMYICKGEYKTSHFAISTGLMALGLMLPGAVSGGIQEQIGYPVFFILVCLLTIPGMATIFFIPLDEEPNRQKS